MNTDHLSGKPTDRRETVICACLHRTQAEIHDAVARLGLETFEDVAAAVLAGSGCTTCRPEVEAILEAARQGRLQAARQAARRDALEPEAPADLPEDVDSEQGAVSAAGRTKD